MNYKEERAVVLERDQYRCVRCGQYVNGSPFGYSLHHRKRRSQCIGEERDNVNNLITLCGGGTTGCHGYVHAHPGEAYEQGYLLHGWEEVSEWPQS